MGWQSSPPWIENFGSGTESPLRSDDNWERIRSGGPLGSVTVSDGKATLAPHDPKKKPPNHRSSVGCTTVTSDENTPVPTDEEFSENSAGTRKNKWTAVSDFYATERFTDPDRGGHHAIFIRVHDRTWDGHPNQTRFGCYINGDPPANPNHPTNPNGYQGCLQFTGDKNVGSGEQKKEIFFDLNEDPFDHLGTWYRVQILEEQRKHGSNWRLYWKAEVWKLAPQDKGQGTLLGDSPWVNENTVKNSYDIKIPSLSGSEVMFAAGPSKDGEVQVSRVATNHWNY